MAFKVVAEKNWGGHLQLPFQTYIDCITKNGADLFLRYNAIYSLVFLLLSFVFLFKKQYSFFALCIIGILIPLLEGSTISQPRFISILFPYSILFGSMISKMRYPNAIIALLFLLQLITFGFWNLSLPLSF